MSAQQKGILPMQGSVGNLTFYKDRRGNFRLRQRNAISRERILTDPVFERTREHISEFRSVIRAGKVICQAIAPIQRMVHDTGMRNRLTSLLCQVVSSDSINERGRRNIMDGNAHLLRDFDLGHASLCPSILKMHWKTGIDRPGGRAAIAVPECIPDESLVAAPGATHFQLHSAAVELDFRTGFWRFNQQSSSLLPLGRWPVAPQLLETSFTPGSPNLVLLLFGITFHLYSNGLWYPLKNRDYNGLRIVEAVQLKVITERFGELPAAQNTGVLTRACSLLPYAWQKSQYRIYEL